MTSLENLEGEEKHGIILNTICLFDDGRKYVHFADENTTLYTLRKIIGAGCNLAYNAFKLYHDKQIYDHDVDQASLGELFPGLDEIVFNVSILPNMMSIENDLISVRVNIQIKCNSHEGKFLSFYCFTCKESICEECRLNAHQGHIVKEKIDYLSSAEVLVNRYFRDIQRIYSIDDGLRQQTAAKILLVSVKNDIFASFRKNIDSLEKKCNDFIEGYINKENESTYNAKEAVEDLRKYSIESFIRLKNDINTNNIILNENIYLTLNNKLEQIDKYKQETLSENLVLFDKMNNIYTTVAGLISELNSDFDKVFEKWMGEKRFATITKEIEKDMVPKVQLKDLIDVVFSNLKIARLSLRQTETFNGLAQMNNRNPRQSISTTKKRSSDRIIAEEQDNSRIVSSASGVKQKTDSKIRSRSKSRSKERKSLLVSNEANNQNVEQILDRANEQVSQINTISIVKSGSKSKSSKINNKEQIAVDQTSLLYSQQYQKSNIIDAMHQKMNELSQEPIYKSFGDNTLVCMFPIADSNLVKVSTAESGVLTLQCTFTGDKDEYYGETFNPSLAYCNYNQELYISGGSSIRGKENKTFLKLTIDEKGNLKAVRLPDSRFHHANHSMIGIDDYVYLIAGEDSNKTERYNIQTNTWELLPNLNSKERINPVLVHYDDNLYVFGGATRFKDVYVQEIEYLDTTSQNPSWRGFDYKSDISEGTCFSSAAYQIVNEDPSKIIFNGGKCESGPIKNLRIFDFKEKWFGNLDLESENSYSFIESNLIRLEHDGQVFYHGFTEDGSPMNFNDIDLNTL